MSEVINMNNVRENVPKDTTIQKPLTVARNDFLQGITELINKTPMPFFVVEDCLKLIASDIHTLATEQEKQEREFYNKQVEESMNKQEKE